MAVDRGYGSGKPRSAANSRARQRVAKGQMTKGPKGGTKTFKAQRAKLAASPIGQLADTLLGFALPVGKVKAAAMGLQAAGKTAAASALRARVLAKESGRNLPKTIALAEKMWTRTPGSSAPTPQAVGKTLLGKLPREASESLFPRLPSGGGVPGAKRTFDKYYDALDEGASRFKSQNLLESMIQGSKSRSGMNRVKTASEVAKALAKYKAPRRGR